MPTQSTTYNTRLTDEALEKRFRDTFRSQGGAELVDDLYASGVIVPVVDFTAAAEGSFLRSDLQTAWDFATDHDLISNTTTTLVTTTGFWQIDLTCIATMDTSARNARVFLSNGLTTRTVWQLNTPSTNSANTGITADEKFVVFVKAGEQIQASSSSGGVTLNVWYRQIADVSGNFTNPTGFVFS